MAADLLLVGEGFSPWTEKALWALDHHGLRYRYEEYTPLVSEPWLRVRARRPSGKITVPYLLGPSISLGDSFAIACEADRLAGGAPLAPSDLLGDIVQWNDLAERLMRAGRSNILARTEERIDVRMESLPAFVPQRLRKPLAGGVRVGTAYLRRKYGVGTIGDEQLEPDLAMVRRAIADREFLLGRFTLADIAVAAALQAVRPHSRFPLGLGPAQRDAWARPGLAARFEDVLAWRDRVVARHRER